MSAPLKARRRRGASLRIYPIDLLRGASRRASAGGPGRIGRSPAPQDRRRLPRLRVASRCVPGNDLTDFLNSTDYLIAFLGDSLRRATSLLGETVDACKHKDVQSLRDHVAKLERECAKQEGLRKALDKLSGYSWTKVFEKLSNDLEKQCEALAADVGAKTSRAISDTCQRWFKSRDSLQQLVKRDLVGLLSNYQEELTRAVSKELSERLVKRGAGVDLPADVAGALEAARIDLPAIARDAHQKTTARP